MWHALQRWLWGRGWVATLPQGDLAALTPLTPAPAPPIEEPVRGWSPALLEAGHRDAHTLWREPTGERPWRCPRCGQRWLGHPQRTCWGVPRYTWETQPAHLTSLTGLWGEGLQPRSGPCGYRLRYHGSVVWLYDRRSAVPHPPLTKHQQRLVRDLPPPADAPTAHRCALCGAWAGRGSWPCQRCQVATEQIALVRSALATQRWAKALLADPEWVLLRLFWRDTPAWEWPNGGGYRRQKGAWRLTLLAPDGTVLLDDLLAPVAHRRRVAPGTPFTLTFHAATLAALRGKRVLVLMAAGPTARWLAKRLREECQPTWDVTWVDVAEQTAVWLAQVPRKRAEAVRFQPYYANPQAELVALRRLLERAARDL
ncbi:MAG: hypothetical protein H0X24_02030 [Ktedonobacterales bacterium]|nr:hypothetical protein [Ktedonobacterales bacterium]